MEINKNKGTKPNAQETQQGTATPAADHGFSVADTLEQYAALNGFAVSNIDSEQFNTAVRELEELAKNMPFTILPVTGDDAGINISSILVCFKRGADYVAAPIFIESTIVEAGAVPRKAQYSDGVNVRTRDYTPKITVTDYASPRAVEGIRAFAKARLGAEVSLPNWTYLPKQFDLKTDLHPIRVCWTTAVGILFPYTPKYAPIPAALVKPGDDPLLITYRGRRNDAIDAMGRPVRADCVIDLIRGQKSDVTVQDVNSKANTPTASVYTSIGYMHVKQDQFNNFVNPGQQTNEFKSVFRPFVKITDVRSRVPNSVGLTCAGLVAALRLLEDRKWANTQVGTEKEITSPVPMSAFIPSQDPAQAGKIVQPDNGRVTMDYIVKIFSQLIRGDKAPLVKMDFEEGGVNAVVAQAFEAMINRPESATAKRAVAEINAMTNNLFSEYLAKAGNPKVGAIDDLTTPMGIYYDADGVQRDIRQVVDLVPLMNISQSKEQLPEVTAFWNTVQSPNYGDADFRFSSLIDYVAGKASIELRAKAFTVTFNGRWLEVLSAAIVNSLNIRSANDYSMQGAVSYQQPLHEDYSMSADVSFFKSEDTNTTSFGSTGAMGAWKE